MKIGGIIQPQPFCLFSEEKITLGEGQDLSRFAGEYFTVRFDDVRLRIDFYLRQGLIVHHILFPDAPAALDRDDLFLEP